MLYNKIYRGRPNSAFSATASVSLYREQILRTRAGGWDVAPRAKLCRWSETAWRTSFALFPSFEPSVAQGRALDIKDWQ